MAMYIYTEDEAISVVRTADTLILLNDGSIRAERTWLISPGTVQRLVEDQFIAPPIKPPGFWGWLVELLGG